ncbi:MAG: tripartite tricarboxylate transporter substrate binding protein [Beijerinckiaceae bacterium]|nr:tripartite tricarboxylate transporter substrate binding protein [Beijerinckiaceae bacterium]
MRALPPHVSRRIAVAIAAFSFFAPCPSWAQAQEYPDRPIRVVLGFAAGSGADIPARFYAEELRKISGGATFIIDNRPGASGNLSIEAGAKAKPDGYTLLLASTATTAGNTALYKNVPFNVEKDLIPIAALHENGFALAVNTASPVQDVAGLTAHLKAKGAKATYGWATTIALASSVIYTTRAGLSVTPVPYKITPQAIADLTGGDLDFAFADVPFAVGQEKAGRIRLIAVTTATRVPGVPNLPTMDELGYPTSGTTALWGLWAPAGTPQPIIDKLGGWAKTLSQSQAVKDFLVPQGASPVTGDTAFMRKQLAEAMATWRKVQQDGKLDPIQ